MAWLSRLVLQSLLWRTPRMLIVATALALLGGGCAEVPQAVDVKLIYARKGQRFAPEIYETLFNASHTEFQSYRQSTPDGKVAVTDDPEALVEGNTEGHGYDLNTLPPATYPIDDEPMRKLPAAYHELQFFKHGRVARNEAHALDYFRRQSTSQEALIVTADGVTTIFTQPSFGQTPMAGAMLDEFKARVDAYHRCCGVYINLKNLYLPKRVTPGGGATTFYDEQRRLQKLAEETKAEAERVRQKNDARDGINRPPQ